MTTSIGYGPEGFSIGFGGGGSSSQRLIKSGRKAIQRQYALQNQNIPAQAEAYRKAGLHPLWAMGGGGSVGNTPPVPLGGRSRGVSGSFSSKVISGPEAASIRESNARTKLLEAQADDLRSSIAARGRQTANSQQDLMKAPTDQAAGNPTIVGQHRVKTGQSLSAQEAEDRWHELGGFAQGLINAGADIVQNKLDPDMAVQLEMLAREVVKKNPRFPSKSRYSRHKNYRSKKKSYFKGPYRPKTWRQ